MNRLSSSLTAWLTIVVAPATCAAADWPQWGGPHRDFALEAAPPLEPWPGESPLVLWRRPLGEGYAGVVTDGERLFTALRRGREEVVVALDADSGAVLWERSYSAPVEIGPEDHLDTTWGDAPAGTPLLADGRLYTLGFTGVLTCLDASSGAITWQRDLGAEDGVVIPYFGHASSPLRYEDTVIVLAGGARAFGLADGEPRWANTAFAASYASGTVIERGGRPLVVAPVAGEVVGFDPRDGELLWRHEHANEHRTFLAGAILDDDDDVLFASAYFLGAVGLRLAADGGAVTEVWENPRFQLSHSNAVGHGPLVLGFHNSILIAADRATGEIVWRQRGFGKANLLRVEDRLLLFDESGKLSLVAMGDGGVELLAEAQVLDGRSWTAPTLVGRRLYVRNHDEIVALDLGRANDGPALATAAPLAAVAPEDHPDLLGAKEELYAAFRRGDSSELERLESAMEAWRDEPAVAHLAVYHAGFAAYQRALAATEDAEQLALLRRAEALLDEAVAAEPRFAEPRALLARLLPMYYRLDPARAAVIGPLGDEHLARALQLEPDNPRVVAVRALDLIYSPPQYGGDPAAGIELLESTLELFAAEASGPPQLEPDWGHATAHLWLGRALARHAPERRLEAAAALERALELAPDLVDARRGLDDLHGSP